MSATGEKAKCDTYNIQTLLKQNTTDFQSTNVGEAAYEADWTNSPASVKTAIQMIVMRSQRPLKLTAMKGLVTLNLETAVHVSCFYLTVNKYLLFYGVKLMI